MLKGNAGDPRSFRRRRARPLLANHSAAHVFFGVNKGEGQRRTGDSENYQEHDGVKRIYRVVRKQCIPGQF